MSNGEGDEQKFVKVVNDPDSAGCSIQHFDELLLIQSCVNRFLGFTLLFFFFFLGGKGPCKLS